MTSDKNWLPTLLIAILAIIWGSSFILMKEGLKVFSPIQMAAYRVFLSGLVFSPFALKHLKQVHKSDRKYALLAGLMGSGIPAFLFAFALTRVNSSLSGILNALTPIWTIIIAALIGSGAITKNKWIGVLIGFAGAIAVVLGADNEGAQRTTDPVFAIFVVIATMFYGANINLIKEKLSKYKAFTIASLPLTVIALPALAILLVTDLSNFTTADPNQLWSSVAAVSALSLFGTAISLILFNRLVQLSGPVVSSTVTYFIPFVAVLIGLAIGESITLPQIGGMILILIGVYAINKRIKSV